MDATLTDSVLAALVGVWGAPLVYLVVYWWRWGCYNLKRRVQGW